MINHIASNWLCTEDAALLSKDKDPAVIWMMQSEADPLPGLYQKTWTCPPQALFLPLCLEYLGEPVGESLQQLALLRKGGFTHPHLVFCQTSNWCDAT